MECSGSLSSLSGGGLRFFRDGSQHFLFVADRSDADGRSRVAPRQDWRDGLEVGAHILVAEAFDDVGYRLIADLAPVVQEITSGIAGRGDDLVGGEIADPIVAAGD